MVPSFPCQLRVCEDVVSAMDYLHRVHQPKVIHRDLKPQNILVDCAGRAYLADFGIARLSERTFLNTANYAMGTLNYMAPELFGSGEWVDEKCDVYSFGMIAYEMFTGLVPWKDAQPMQLAMKVGIERCRPDIPSDCPERYRALITLCWVRFFDKLPIKRPLLEVCNYERPV